MFKKVCQTEKKVIIDIKKWRFDMSQKVVNRTLVDYKELETCRLYEKEDR
ncbi:hypothetical protein [Wolbachia endosymbiont of Oedothorax gibbosus]|nr:hypothetical protein [Wolbachia endosymbiont of Oedothorax gibbosus]